MFEKSLEQENIFEEVKNGTGNLLINAKAGTGKTTTIVKSLDLIDDDKNIILLAFNRHIANELKERVPNKKNIRISTTHALGWGAIRRKYKEAVIDEDKAFNVIRRKINRWNLEDVDDIDQYVLKIKKMVDLCRVTLTTRRQFIPQLAQKHGIEMTDEDCRRVLSVMEEMLNDTKTFDFIDMIYIPAIDNKVWLFPNDYVFVDECIDGRCGIINKNNDIINIGELYEKHTDNDNNIINIGEFPEILTYNVETNKNEYKKITNMVYKGHKNVSMVKIEGTYMFATLSHLFYTMDGWRELNDLRIGDAILSNEYNRFNNCYYPDDEQLDFLNSYLVCYYLNERQANILKFRIYIKDYDDSKTSLINRITPIYVKSNKPDINTIEYSTVKFYINSKIYNKEYIIKNLSIKQLAIIYILSAKYYKDEDKYGFCVSVSNFDEMVYAKQLFDERFDKIFDIKKYLKAFYLIPRDQDWFFTTICEYVPIEFKRDIPYKYWNIINDYRYQKNKDQQYCGVISLIEKDKRKVNIYDISVQDNHNFYITSVDSKSFRERKEIEGFAGFLVHNCQDYNKAQQFMLNKIIKKDTGRLISVGDNHQCQPTGTKVLMSDGNEKNIEDIVIGEKVVSYDRKDAGVFRGFNKRKINYGYKIIEKSKRFINENLIVIESAGKKSKYTYNHKCFAKFKKEDTSGYILYLMELNGFFRLGISPLWSKNKISSLTNRAKHEKAEKFWVLDIYKNKNDSYFDEQYYSVKYGIPQMIFTHRCNGKQNQEKIDKFYNRFDKTELLNSANELLNAFNRKYEYPLWSIHKFNYFSKTHIFKIEACNLIAEYMEVTHFNPNNIGTRKHGKCRADTTIKSEYKKIDKLYYEEYIGDVYSLKVEKYETYIADGILTHNSIYGFNGSGIDSFNWFREKENTVELPLSTSYRCPKRVIELAQTIVPSIRYKEGAEDGEVTQGSVLELAKPGDYVLARKNKPLVVLLFDLLRQNKMATIRGNDIGKKLAETVSKYKSVTELNTGLTEKLNEMRDHLINNMGVIDFRTDQRYVSLEDNVEIIRFLINNTNTIERILEKLSLIFTDNPTGIILSTIHKSKGLEADTVFIIRPDEIRLKTPLPEVALQEANLEYIAYTRSKNKLIFDHDWTDERD